MARRFFRPWVWWGGLVLIVCAGSAAVWRLWPAAPDRPSTPGDLPRTHSAQSLPDEDRAYIWDIEHQGLVLKKYGFGSLKAALRDENAPRSSTCWRRISREKCSPTPAKLAWPPTPSRRPGRRRSPAGRVSR